MTTIVYRLLPKGRKNYYKMSDIEWDDFECKAVQDKLSENVWETASVCKHMGEAREEQEKEYLKELELTEGRSAGIPTIQNVLKANGSTRAIVVTDEERTIFRITIPCHEGAGNIIDDIANRDGSPISSPISSPNTADAIIAMIKENPNISTSIMAGKLGISKRAVIKHTNQLQVDGKIRRNGSAKSGFWEIISD